MSDWPTRRLRRVVPQEAVPIIDAAKAIEIAIKVDDHYDRLEFLTAWRDGDWETVRDIMGEVELAEAQAACAAECCLKRDGKGMPACGSTCPRWVLAVEMATRGGKT